MMRPIFVSDFLAAVDAHDNAQVHHMSVAWAKELADYIRRLETNQRGIAPHHGTKHD